MGKNLIIRPHVLSDRDEIRGDVAPGHSLQAIVDSVWPEEVHENVVMTINGEWIPREHWPHIYPKETAFVRGTLVFTGGGGSKNFLAVAASIALAIAAPEIGIALYGQTLAGFAVAAGISIVGTLAINALFKPPAVDIGGANNSGPASKVYSITGQSNQASPYGVCPRVFGKFKLFPRLAATPFIDAVGDDQYLIMLLDFGHGPLQLENILIGETPIAAYQDVIYNIYPAYKAGDPLAIYYGDVAVEQVAVELQPQVFNVRTTEAETLHIVVTLSFPKGLIHYWKDGSEGDQSVPISIRLSPAGQNSWTPVNAYRVRTSHANANFKQPIVSLNLNGTVTVLASGNLGDSGRSGIRYGLAAGTYALQWQGGTFPPPGSILVLPDGFRTQVVGGAGAIMLLADPLPHDYVVAIGGDPAQSKLALSYFAAAPIDGVIMVTGRQLDAFVVDVHIDVPLLKYDIEIFRLSPLPTDNRTSDAVFWTAVRSYANRPPIAPAEPHTIMELRVKATDQLQGVIQNISAEATGLLTTWAPGVGFVENVATRNPAWAFLEVLIGRANARRIDISKVDLNSIYNWSLYCDALVSNGKAPEPRFFFDHVCDYATTVYRMLETIASAGRATVSWRDGRIGVIVDQEQTLPVQLFTPRNSWGFSTQRKYLDMPDALRMQFTDPYGGYQQGTMVAYDDGFDALTASKFEDVQTVGITRASQAWRDGRYMIAQARLRREEFTIQTDLENLACLRGDLVWVQHDVLKVGGDSSRVTALLFGGTQIQQADNFGNLPPDNYGIRIRKDTGEIVGPIAAVPIAPNIWNVGAAIPGVAVDDLIVWGLLGVETGEYLVKTITPGPDLGATLALVEIARGIYTADQGDMPPYNPPANGRPDGTIAQPVTNLQVLQVNKTLNRRPAVDIYVIWTPPRYGNYPVVRVYGVGYNLNLTSLAEAHNKNGALIYSDVDLLTSVFLERTVYFAAQAFDAAGAQSAITYTQENIVNPLWVPDDITYFSSNVNGNMVTLTWRDPLPTGNLGNDQVIAYDIRHSPNVNAYFDQATRVSELIDWTTHTVTVPAINGVYMIKPITTSGIRSKVAARTVISTQALILRDWYDQPRFAPAWAGQFINCEKVGGTLRLLRDPNKVNEYYRQGFWIANFRESFNQDIVSRITTFLHAYGYQPDDVLAAPRWTPIANADPIQGFSTEEFDVKLWVASSDRLSTVLADWTPIASAVPIAGTSIDLTEDSWPIIAAELEARQLFFIIELRSLDGSCTPVVTDAGADIDFPERLESHPDVATPAAGLRLVWDYPFVWTPNIAIDLQNAAVGDYVQRTNADQYGVDIVVKNNAGVGKVGSVDVQAWGVGRVIV